jgi:D-Lysine 5,6-aminomutase TIM-barrel domain of alpha subunit
MPHLKLDQSLVDEARALASHIVEPVIDYINAHTTVAIERTTLKKTERESPRLFKRGMKAPFLVW